MEERDRMKKVQALEASMRDEKQAAKDARLTGLLQRRRAQAEKERTESLQAKMHAKRLARLHRREKRSKALAER